MTKNHCNEIAKEVYEDILELANKQVIKFPPKKTPNAAKCLLQAMRKLLKDRWFDDVNYGPEYVKHFILALDGWKSTRKYRKKT